MNFDAGSTPALSGGNQFPRLVVTFPPEARYHIQIIALVTFVNDILRDSFVGFSP
jgi:hypothetical protein